MVSRVSNDWAGAERQTRADKASEIPSPSTDPSLRDLFDRTLKKAASTPVETTPTDSYTPAATPPRQNIGAPVDPKAPKAPPTPVVVDPKVVVSPTPFDPKPPAAPAPVKTQIAMSPVMPKGAIDKPLHPANSETPPPAFTPRFREVSVSSSLGGKWGLNSNYFADRATADWIAKKFGTGEVVEKPYGGNGGVFKATEDEFHIKLADGRTVNAGILAAYYDRNPVDKFPGVADSLIKRLLDSEKPS